MSAEEWTTAEHVEPLSQPADEYPRRARGRERPARPRAPRRPAHPRPRHRRRPPAGPPAGGSPAMLGVGLDFSALMLDAARERFAGDERIELVEHDLAEPLPELGRFDAVVSSMAIHHLEHDRKRSLYGEVFDGARARRHVRQLRARRVAERAPPPRLLRGDRRADGARGPVRPPARRGACFARATPRACNAIPESARIVRSIDERRRSCSSAWCGSPM